MADRIQILRSVPGQEFPGAPVKIERGNLLKDNANGRIILQLGLRNVQDRPVTTLTVEVKAKDADGAELEGLSAYTYQGFEAAEGQMFGDRVPVLLPDAATDDVEVSVLSAGFADGGSWEPEKELSLAELLPDVFAEARPEVEPETAHSAPDPEEVSALPEAPAEAPEQEAPKPRVPDLFGDGAAAPQPAPHVYSPMPGEDVPSADEEHAAQPDEPARTYSAMPADEPVKKKKGGARGLIAALLAVVLLAGGFFAVRNLILPAVSYSKAQKLLEQKQYDEAYEAFDKLGDYKDAAQMALESGYLKAKDAFDGGRYDEAADIFKGISTYRDAGKMYRRSILENAKQMASGGQFEKAMKELIPLLTATTEGGNAYLDEASDLYTDCIRECYERELAAGNAVKALSWFTDLPASKRYEGEYEHLMALVGDVYRSAGEWKDAIGAYEAAKGEDVEEGLLAAMYGYVTEHQDPADTDAGEYIQKLTDAGYADSKDIRKKIYAWVAVINVGENEKDYINNLQSVSKYKDIYCNITLTGGEPGAKTDIKCVATFPGGGSATNKWSGSHAWYTRTRGSSCFYITNPSSAKTGTITIKVYDGDGNVIGQTTVELTD